MMSAKLQRRYNAGRTWLRSFILYPLYSAIHISLCFNFFLYHPHRTFHQLIISLPEAHACFSPLFSSPLAKLLFFSFFFFCLLSYVSPVPSLPLFRLTLFCSGNRPARVALFSRISVFFSIFLFLVSLRMSLYAGRSSKRRIIVGPRPILLFRNEQYGLLPPSSWPTSQTACVWPQIERYYLRILPRNFFTTLSPSLPFSVFPPFLLLLSLFFLFLFLFLSLKHLSPYIFFSSIFLPR